MYLERNQNDCSPPGPAACPAGWTQIDLAEVVDVGGNCRRTCVRSDRTCVVTQLRRTDLTGLNNPCGAVATTPPACPTVPAVWTQADVQNVDGAALTSGAP
jgi:hypothetical protein